MREDGRQEAMSFANDIASFCLPHTLFPSFSLIVDVKFLPLPIENTTMQKETYIWDKGYERPTEEERIYTFVSSCIESAAIQLGCKASDMYKRMARVNLINDYLIPCYDTLHTESRSNVTEDVIETLKYWEEKKGADK